MSKYIDVKEVVWNRYFIPEELEIPEFKNTTEVYDFIDDNELWENAEYITDKWPYHTKNDVEVIVNKELIYGDWTHPSSFKTRI